MNKWFWTEEENINTYVMARRSFTSGRDVERAVINVAADSRYMIWVNGEYLGRGPVPFKLPHVFYDSLDISQFLKEGKNVISILAAYHGVRHCTYTPDRPGIWTGGLILLPGGNIIDLSSASGWKVMTLKAYMRHTPRRTWATAFTEYYDARLEPQGWREVDFDDSLWEDPRIYGKDQVLFHERMTPYLKEEFVGFKDIVLKGEVPSGIPFLPDENNVVPPGLTSFLDGEEIMSSDKPCGLVLEPSHTGCAMTFDMGKEYAGSIYFEVETKEGVHIDLCPAENLKDGRPWCYRKKGEYARRYITKEGNNRFSFFGYDGIRYIHMVIRGDHPLVDIKEVGVIRRETSMPIKASFSSSDENLNRIWEITKNTYYGGSQEIQVDCPTREQTSAWGDNILSGLWSVYFTGDSSFLKHLLLTMDHVIMEDGQLPCYPFSSVHNISPVHEQLPLYDYSLIAVMGLGFYHGMTGDLDFVKTLFPTAKRILDWYRQHMGKTGLIEADFDYLWKEKIGQLFIDHPGLGNHNAPHPGIDRRGINASINFFYILAAETLSKLYFESGLEGEGLTLKREIETMRQSCDRLFFCTARQVYADGNLNGQLLNQISQQTNALAVLSRTCTGKKAVRVLQNILKPKIEGLCLCGTYFWYYLGQALCLENMEDVLFSEITRLWIPMADGGATTWWETFTGDELDSLCHIWSSCPGYFLFSQLLGIKPAGAGFSEVLIKPRPDILDRVEGSMVLPQGYISLSWKRDKKEGVITLSVGENIGGKIVLPKGYVFQETGDCSVEFSPLTEKNYKISL